MAKPNSRKSLIEEIRQASGQTYARRAAESFGGASGMSEAERRKTYEQGWLDCLDVMLGMANPESSTPVSRTNAAN